MNCKQGDLAVIVRSLAGNEGKIVRCVQLLGQQCAVIDPRRGIELFTMWQVEPSISDWRGYQKNSCADEFLRPLRDSEGEDEVLRLVGLPVGTPQAA